MRYLLDTNVISDLVRHPKGRVARRIRQVGQSNICTSIIVVCESRFGVAKRGSVRLSQQLEVILKALIVEPFEAPADTAYATLRSDLERNGTPISGNDMLIAAHAITLGAILITANEREFARVQSLRCENWLA
jgi:tRNA(fMet)-specific endonuclease VapC